MDSQSFPEPRPASSDLGIYPLLSALCQGNKARENSKIKEMTKQGAAVAPEGNAWSNPGLAVWDREVV